ncbi:MAG TPA: Rnf-Nqr domain containing protein [Clostridia bacterium]|nr:Rnf-Nqr domain containing protein [Clostridia bacterium]
MNWFLSLMNAALYIVLIQNLVFSGGYGASEVIRMAAKPRRLADFSLMIAYFATITAVISRILDFNVRINELNFALHSALFGAVLVTIYLLSVIVLKLFLKPSRKFLSMMGMAALNTLVFAIPLLNRRIGNTFVESIGFGIGSAVAFIFAISLISIGLKRLEANQNIPRSFKGAPAMFLYVALLSMAFTGISGTSMFS